MFSDVFGFARACSTRATPGHIASWNFDLRGNCKAWKDYILSMKHERPWRPCRLSACLEHVFPCGSFASDWIHSTGSIWSTSDYTNGMPYVTRLLCIKYSSNIRYQYRWVCHPNLRLRTLQSWTGSMCGSSLWLLRLSGVFCFNQITGCTTCFSLTLATLGIVLVVTPN